MSQNVQTLRLRKPTTDKTPAAAAAAAQKQKLRHTGLLQEQLRRTAKPPWCPNLLLAFRMLLLVRFAGAMYSNITDCDEVFNFWEPLHFVDQGYGFQTWELSPAYAIRSWAYIILHWPFARLPVRLLAIDKRHAFFAVRVTMAVVSSFAEARLYRAVVECINERVGRYLLVILMSSAGMWNAATAFLPSSFAMYTTSLAMSYALFPPALSPAFVPPTFPHPFRRTLAATLLFATGAIVGWPFSILLAVPFAFEELFLCGADLVPTAGHFAWTKRRIERFSKCIGVAVLLAIPVVAIDTLFYGRPVVTSLNIILYNVFGGSTRGPDLYGTEPTSFYILNLVLNLNIVLPLSLLTLPALFISYLIDHKRIDAGFDRRPSGPSRVVKTSSAYTLIAIRALPAYIWLGVLTAQAHKEERFMFPAYPLLCFNAAVTLYLCRGWAEAVFMYITKSPYRAGKTTLFRTLTGTILACTVLLSVSRILALNRYYHAPLGLAYHFEYAELPRVMRQTGLLPPLPPPSNDSTKHAAQETRIDLRPVKRLNLTVCVGKEWYRFPGHYLVPTGVRVRFVRSAFDGQLPRLFDALPVPGLSGALSVARGTPEDLNDLNRPEPGRFVDVAACDYLIDLDFPLRGTEGHELEPRYAVDIERWDRAFCAPFLDASRSSRLTRLLWLPGVSEQGNVYGDYCLLRNRARAAARESRKW